MQRTKLAYSLQKNLQILETIFGDSGDFYTKELTISGIPCAIVMFTGLSSPENYVTLLWRCWTATRFCLAGAKGCVTIC